MKRDVNNKINEYFKKGKQAEEAEHQKRQQAEETALAQQKSIKFFNWLPAPKNIRSGKRSNSDIDFDPSSPILTFSGEKEARDLLLKIQDSLKSIIVDKESGIKEAMNFALKQFQGSFSENVMLDTGKIVNDLSSRMEKSGFSINLAIPDASLLSMNSLALI